MHSVSTKSSRGRAGSEVCSQFISAVTLLDAGAIATRVRSCEGGHSIWMWLMWSWMTFIFNEAKGLEGPPYCLWYIEHLIRPKMLDVLDTDRAIPHHFANSRLVDGPRENIQVSWSRDFARERRDSES